MPAKRGKRGRPKKVKTEGDDEPVIETSIAEGIDEEEGDAVDENELNSTGNADTDVITLDDSQDSKDGQVDGDTTKPIVEGCESVSQESEEVALESAVAAFDTSSYNDDKINPVPNLNNIDMEPMETDENEEIDFNISDERCDNGDGNKIASDDETKIGISDSKESKLFEHSSVDIDYDMKFGLMEEEEGKNEISSDPIDEEDSVKKEEDEIIPEAELEDSDVMLEHETETVSEDELPSESIKPPSDTEAVSDEELPPNNAADHLLDTEAVSEDELPPIKKKKIDADGEAHKKTEAVEEGQSKTSLKRSSSAVSDSSDGGPTKKSSVESKSNKALLELEKYWKAVREDPADFTGWTYLLQYVDQGQDVIAAREAYDAFLSHYPYCYGYWRKYADYEKKKGDKAKSQEVFERGLAAIPLSVDLWLHYLNHIKNSHKEEEEYIREQYNRAIDVCGIEFRSDRLWDSYIKWETDCKNIAHVFNIFDKLLTVPTQGYKGHFENFVDFVKANQPNKMLSVDEFLSIRSEILQKLKQKGASEVAPAANAPPGDESDGEAEKSPTFADEETKLMRDKIIALRTKSFKAMSNSVLDRWNFEEGIKRPYFHVKPLERCQLNNWRSYLDYEIGQGDKDRTIVLFERCLIACALYDEFWVKYVKYLETLSGDDIIQKIRNVYERACTIHHPKKPMLSLNWASFEENNDNIEGARVILLKLEKEVPNSLQISICKINLERRAKNFEQVSKLYDHYIVNNKNKYATNALSIKYARFCQKILNDVDKGSEVLRKAIEKDKDNPRLYHQLLDLVFSKIPRGPEQEEECVNIINQFLDRESTDMEHKLLFAQHKVEFLEDFGSSMSNVQKAVSDYMNLLKQVKERRRKQFEEKMKSDDKKVKSGDGTAPAQTNATSNGNSSGGGGGGAYQSGYPASQQASGYQNSSSSQYQQPSNYGQPPYNQYNSQSDPNYNNYQNWNYSQTPGYNNYNQGWGSYNYY